MLLTPNHRFLVVAFAALVGLGLIPRFAAAHNMSVRVTLDPKQPDVLKIKATFDDESPAAFAKATLVDESRTIVSEEKTDSEGLCEIPRPKSGTYVVTVTDEFGHLRSETIEVPHSTEELRSIESPQRNRLLMTMTGLVLITALTILARLVRKKRSACQSF